MKKIYLSIIITGLLFLFSTPLKAQVHFNLNINIGNQPVWGPVGYDYVEYYYMPDIDVYYNVPQGLYFYYEGGNWVSMAYLPARYHDYDLYHGYKVVINESRPWRHHAVYQKKYGKFKGRHDQRIIRDSRDERYYVIKDHPQHKLWKEKGRRDNKFERKDNGRNDGFSRNKGNDFGNNRKDDKRGGGNGNGHGKRK